MGKNLKRGEAKPLGDKALKKRNPYDSMDCNGNLLEACRQSAKDPRKNKYYNFLRCGFCGRSRREEERLASGPNRTTTNEELPQKTKQKLWQLFLRGS